MRLTVAAVLAALAVPAYAGGLRHHLPPGSGLPPLYGGGYTPLACAATVFSAPRGCRRWGSPHAVSRRARAAHRVSGITLLR
jgi:hypothetical protein